MRTGKKSGKQNKTNVSATRRLSKSFFPKCPDLAIWRKSGAFCPTFAPYGPPAVLFAICAKRKNRKSGAF